jgi:hypothetical protein
VKRHKNVIYNDIFQMVMHLRYRGVCPASHPPTPPAFSFRPHPFNSPTSSRLAKMENIAQKNELSIEVVYFETLGL